MTAEVRASVPASFRTALSATTRATTRATLLALGLLGASIALAQAPRWPDAADIERAWQTRPFPGADQLGAQPVPAPPRVNVPPVAANTDIEALARAGARLGSPSAPRPAASPLRIFITLEMPRASLQLLTDQAARSGAVLVLRGLKANSMRDTLASVASLIGERQVAWVIDPEAFARYRIERAPTFLLSLDDRADPTTGCGTDCRLPPAFVSVSGDVSLDHALHALARQRPEAGPRVAPMLKRLRGS
jgi:conjugal transfer pilus assembly protein TrbC